MVSNGTHGMHTWRSASALLVGAFPTYKINMHSCTGPQKGHRYAKAESASVCRFPLCGALPHDLTVMGHTVTNAALCHGMDLAMFPSV